MMKRIYGMAAIFFMLVAAGAAQDAVTVDALKKGKAVLGDVKITGAVMGPVVKGSPYSGVELTENTQVLGDGTRIHREDRTTVYRDSEGRLRRETPDQITIWDPVANASYSLDPKSQTVHKLPLGMGGRGGFVSTSGTQTFEFRTNAPNPQDIAKIKAQIGAMGANAGGPVFFAKTEVRRTGKSESLGRQTIEGVNAEGTRMTSTIEAGAIGNDRPIQSVSESWYSPELQTLIKSVHTDPRTGEETFQLTNVSRVEQPAYLFQIPAGYQAVERK
jgi:opacity protein-like surface antigen